MKQVCKQIQDDELKKFIGKDLNNLYLWESYDKHCSSNEHYAFVNFVLNISDEYILVSNDDGRAKIGNDVFDFNDFQIKEINQPEFNELMLDKNIEVKKKIESIKVFNEKMSFYKNSPKETEIYATRAFLFCLEDNEEIAVVRSLEEWNSEMNIKIGTNLSQEILNMDDGASYWDTEMYFSVKREINELD